MMKDAEGDTPLHYACGGAYHGASYYAIELLLDVGGKDLVMEKNKDGSNALHRLCDRIKRNAKVAEKTKILLEVGDANVLLSTKDKGY